MQTIVRPKEVHIKHAYVQTKDRLLTFSFNANAGKIAESRSEEKCGETRRHPCKHESRWTYEHKVRAYESIMNPNYQVQILTGPVSKTREITSNANENIRLGRESSPYNHLAILGSHPVIINKSYYRSIATSINL